MQELQSLRDEMRIFEGILNVHTPRSNGPFNCSRTIEFYQPPHFDEEVSRPQARHGEPLYDGHEHVPFVTNRGRDQGDKTLDRMKVINVLGPSFGANFIHSKVPTMPPPCTSRTKSSRTPLLGTHILFSLKSKPSCIEFLILLVQLLQMLKTQKLCIYHGKRRITPRQSIYYYIRLSIHNEDMFKASKNKGLRREKRRRNTKSRKLENRTIQIRIELFRTRAFFETRKSFDLSVT
ncbi:hypothetical protein M9H77_00543 [Catharanthus roseus]|nr:hypothetical protein M9H77_00543 [Catharanthus roseus]